MMHRPIFRRIIFQVSIMTGITGPLQKLQERIPLKKNLQEGELCFKEEVCISEQLTGQAVSQNL